MSKRIFIILFVLIALLHNMLGNACARSNQTDSSPFVIATSYRVLLANQYGTGMLDRIHKETFKRAGIPVEIVYMPTARALEALDDGVIDAIQNRISGMERMFPHLVMVPEPNMIMEFVGFSQNASIHLESWEDLQPYQIGIVKGWKILENNTSNLPYRTFVHSAKDLFTLLDKGRLDIVLYSRLTGLAALQELGLNGIHSLREPLARREMHLYVHQSQAHLIPAISKALRSLKEDGTYRRIVEQTEEQSLNHQKQP